MYVLLWIKNFLFFSRIEGKLENFLKSIIVAFKKYVRVKENCYLTYLYIFLKLPNYV